MKVVIDELLQVLRLSTVRLFNELKKCPCAIAGEHYVLWYKGEGLPCLVAHIDHVYDESKGWAKRPILYNEEYIWSPRGIAGDDRAGVYVCMQLFKSLDVNVLFCDIEERGGVGAMEACEEPKLANVPYFIEVDRKGYKEAVFYNGEEIDLPEFAEVISQYFEIGQGTFSDISILGEHFNVASVNLSAGYYNPHQESAEYIHVPSLEYTLRTIPTLISELGCQKYKLPELPLWSHYSHWGKGRRVRTAKSTSYLWWYDDYTPEVEEEVSKESDCPIDCYDCGALDYDQAIGYWCWEIEGAPDPEHPRCLKKILKEVGPWL
jgi:hypothetical protein